MRTRSGSSVFSALLLIVALGFACSGEMKQPTPSAAPVPAPAATPVPVVEPIDRDNGVFYFPVTGDAYIASLAKFYEGNGKHCDLQGFTERVVYFYGGQWTAEMRGGYTNNARTETTGFILHCHDIAIDAQNVTSE